MVHRPFGNARGKLYEREFLGDELRMLRRRTDLDGGLTPGCTETPEAVFPLLRKRPPTSDLTSRDDRI